MKNKKSLLLVAVILISAFVFSSCIFKYYPYNPPVELIFEGVVFENKTYEYDNTIKRIEVEGLPEGAEVEYKNNDKIEIGEYEVTATITKEGYKTLVLKATLKIIKSSSPV